MSTKQIHPLVREWQQLIKDINRRCNYKNTRRRRNWWKAYNKRNKVVDLKEYEK